MKRNDLAEQAPPIAAIDRQLARTLSGAVAAGARLAFARGFTVAVVQAYARASGLAPPRPAPEAAPLAAEAREAAENLGQGIAAAPPESAGPLIGAVYTSALPEDYRARHGIFYTPPGLVAHLLDMAEAAGTDWRRARVLDPACGGGVFLVAAAGRIIRALEGVAPALVLRHLARRLRGFDLDPFGCWLAQAMLDIALAPLARAAGRKMPDLTEARDSLDLQARDLGRFDLVVGNPPYGRISLPPDRRAVFARATYGHANLFGLFTDAALRWTAGSGLVAYVTPTSMLSGLYHKALRALLVRDAPPVALDLVAARAGVFDDVLQETMLAVYRRGGRMARAGAPVGFLALGADGAVVARRAGLFRLPEDAQAPWLLPRAPDQVALTRRLRRMPHRLADYGYGVSTGPLVWNRFKPQLRDQPGRGLFPVVWAECISADGHFAWRTARRNHAPWFAANLPRDAWLLTDQPCVLLQRTTAKEQKRRLIAAEMPLDFVRRHGRAVVENHLNMVRPIVAAPAVPAAAIAALLNSEAADAAFRCINGSVAVSAFELEGMPVPPPSVLRRVAALLASGAARPAVEAVIAASYGIAPDAG